jgi:signal transduction histidine kinase
MVPYRGRFALRIARLILSILCFGWYLRTTEFTLKMAIPLLAVHLAYAIFVLMRMDLEAPLHARIALAVDTGYYVLWVWLAPGSWQPVFACAYLLASVALLQNLAPTVMVTAGAVLIALFIPSTGPGQLSTATIAAATVAVPVSVYRWYLERRMSTTLRHNVIIRSQSQIAREAERQRIAADFHDGPLQSFVGFQMRLEIIRKQMERDPAAALEELRALQELCKSQVTDLRTFVRSMRPIDEGMSLAASLARMAESLQRDTGITTTFSGADLQDPQEIDIALEILQIVREAFNNIQKHSGAKQVSLRARRSGHSIEIVVEDKGNGFPFAGTFTLDELDALRTGPFSIKRRIRMLGGDLTIDSRPGEGAKLLIEVPC